MDLLIIRHGDAESAGKGIEGPGLTENGRAILQKLAEQLRNQGVRPEIFMTSPLARAVQTAEILNRPWGVAVQQVPWLRPSTEPEQILVELEKISLTSVALVGHLPSLGWLLSFLTGGDPFKEIALPKASVTSINLKVWEPGAAEVEWMIP